MKQKVFSEGNHASQSFRRRITFFTKLIASSTMKKAIISPMLPMDCMDDFTFDQGIYPEE